MQRHADYGFLPKTQPDLNPVVHVSPYRQSQYNITGIVISFIIAGDHLGSRPRPRILLYFNSSSRTRGGDTPDTPHNHLGTRGPSSSTEVPTCVTKIECHTRISCEELGRWTEDPYLVREYLPRTMS
ncbi:disease resistance protein [Dorcoceras hygrometricum]|uniref:Disease resistance protein n=1 Tax=Dorcoceras hygrometricum TaxID=472368 RepID=A0A2Z7D688_9LAMI|nr:disease resistance protein [Dorcoceras hygrometricum]